MSDIEMKPKKKRKLKKKKLIQFLFCFVSIIFIIGCFVFYGNRLIKYYRIYNPKTDNGKKVDLISSTIMSKSQIANEGDGLYKTSSGSIYKGKEVNNYIKYSGLLWRIIKISNDGTLDIILDQSINILKWNSKITSYNESDINKYLNEKFIKVLNKDLITNTTVCTDVINDLNKTTCDKPDASNLVRLLNINEFLNSKLESSYVIDGNNLWLSNRGDDKVWNINDSSVSYSSSTETYEIKPVVTLKNSNILEGGKGTLEEPYVVKEKVDKLSVGKYIKLDNDVWTIYDVEGNTLKLTLSTLLDDMFQFGDTNLYDLESDESVAYYLNNDFYEKLSYKDSIVDGEWFIGEYNNSYKDIENKKVTSKVGMLSIADFKFDNNLSGYYLLNGEDSKSYMYKDMLILSKSNLYRYIRPAINITKSSIKNGDGTLSDPYVLEVK